MSNPTDRSTWSIKQIAGSLGGRATAKKYGKDYMRQIARRGAETFHKKYKLVPYKMADFLIVNRETGAVMPKTQLGFEWSKDQ